MDFSQFANYILNKTFISCNGHHLRICEIEFYLKSKEHPDPYVHDTPDQHTYGNWYFHKTGTGSYRGGTFKGLDITFGSADIAFGVLIRSVYDSKIGIIEGPCKSVNRILDLLEVKSIVDFTQGKLLGISHDKLMLKELKEYDSQNVIRGPRIGLSDKYP